MELTKKKRFNSILFLILLELIFSWSFTKSEAMAEEILVDGLSALYSDAEGKGYSVCRFNITSLTTKRLVVTVRLDTSTSYSNGGFEVEKQIELMPKETREERIFYPNLYRKSLPKVYFYIGRKQVFEGVVEKNTSEAGNTRYGYNSKHVLIDRKITKTEVDKLLRDPDESYGSTQIKAYYFNGSEKEFAKDWLSYTEFDALMFYDNTFKELLKDAAGAAIMDYVKAGGSLFILGSDDCLSEYDSYRGKDYNVSKDGGIKKSFTYGLGQVSFFDRDLFGSIKSSPPKKTSNSTHSSWSDSRSKSSKTEETVTETLDGGRGIYKPVDIMKAFGSLRSNMFDKESLNQMGFKVSTCFDRNYKMTASPVILMIFVFVFALFMGPLNLFYLHKHNLKIMVFITVPIISLICCAIVFGYFLLFEYGRLNLYRQSFTLLDENSNSSLTFGGELIVSGRTLNNELKFPMDSLVMPVNVSYRYGDDRNSNRSIKLDKVQNFTYNWIKAKSPFAFSIVSSKQDRSRLEVTSTSDNQVEMHNYLGADIELVYYLTRDNNRLVKGTNIVSGKKGSAEYTGFSGGGTKSGSFRLNSFSFPTQKNYKRIDFYNLLSHYDNNSKTREAVERYAKDTLKPGEYIAFLKKNIYMKQDDLDWKADVSELGCFVHGKTKSGGSL